MSAIDLLNPQALTDQLEALGSDVDISSLSLVFEGKEGFELAEMITAGTVERTIEGASTLSLDVFDRDRALVTSGLLGANVDVLIDTLWFRLVGVNKQLDTVSLTFEDREIATLRMYPDRADPKTWPLLISVDHLPKPPQGRAEFARRLVRGTADLSGTPIRFRCPALADDTELTKRVKRAPALPPPGTYVPITVQNYPADREQLAVITAVLDEGTAMHVPGILLIAAIMTITAESTARNLSGGDRDSVGAFQQRPSGGRPDGKGNWPASRDVKTDAHAFFEVALYKRDQFEHTDPRVPVTVSNVAAFCSEIQRDSSWNTDHQGAPYAPWLVEATETVTKYQGGGDPTLPTDSKQATDSAAKAQNLTFEDTLDTARHFYRGVPAKSRWGREDNFSCLKRLADEVRWRCFCVSGTVYFISEPDLFKSTPEMVISEAADGVDSIDWRYDVGQHNASVTVQARVARWQAPPGTVVILEDSGPVDGRWIVSNIRRPIFNQTATITLKKPRPVLPESQAPEYGTSSASGTTAQPKKPTRKRKPPAPQQPPPAAAAYVFPIPGNVEWWEARVDMGKDLETGAAGIGHYLFAIGDGEIVRISDGGGFGPWYTVLLLDPLWQASRPSSNAYGGVPQEAGNAVFYGHCADPQVAVGSRVRAGQPILKIRGVGSGGAPLTNLPGHMEIGWANPYPASGYTALAYPHYHEGDHTPEGEDFWQFLSSIRANTQPEL